MVKNVPANVPAADTRDGFDPRLGRSPGVGNSQKKKGPEKLHGQRNLACYSPCGCKELGTTEQQYDIYHLHNGV